MGSIRVTVDVSRRSALRTMLGALGAAAASSLLAACQQAAPTAAPPAPTSAPAAPTSAAAPAKPAAATGNAPAPTSAPAAASSAKPTTLAELALYTGPDRQAILEEGAKKEGQLLWYTTNIVDQIARPLQQNFQAKYPFVKVDFYRANGTELLQRIDTEYQANRYDVDVVNALDIVASLKQQNLLQKFISPELAPYPPELKDPDQMWGGTYLTYFVLGYNPQLVSDADVPRTYEALLDKKWTKKLIWSTSPSTGGPIFVGNTLRSMGPEKGNDYLQKLAQVGVTNSDAATRALLDQVIAGDFSVNVVTVLHHAVISKGQGAPVAWTEPDPIYGIFDQAGLAGKAPHPHASLLFLDYLFSQEGQKLYVDLNYAPAHPNLAAKDPALTPPKRGVKVNFMNGETMATSGREWQQLYQKLFVR